jgi:tetratricopeptide (TPR) repeat protein
VDSIEKNILENGNNSKQPGDDYFLRGEQYLDQYKFSAAIIELETALKLHRALLQPFHPMIAEDLTLLGIIHWNLTDYYFAHKCFYDALEIDKRNFRFNHPKILRNINNLGLINKSLKRIEQSIWHFNRALNLSKSESPYEADILVNLALAYAEISNLGDAKFYINKALEIDNYKKNELNTARDLMFLGYILLKNENSNKVIDILKQAVDLFKKNNHYIDAATCMTYIGDAVSEISLKKQNYDKASCILKELCDKSDPDLKSVERRIVRLYS